MRKTTVATLVLSAALMAQVKSAGFDVKTLEGLGYGSDVADFFDKPRFLPGVQQVMLEVNASRRYQETVRFDQEGGLCLDTHLADVLRLRMKAPPEACERFETLWPEAQVRVFPGAFRVEITLPETAFDDEKFRSDQLGGYAVLMNYDLYANRMQGSNGTQQTFQAMLEPGVNVSNWVLRNRTSYNKDTSGTRLDVYETSALRDFPQWETTTRLGEFSAGSALSGYLPITGAQLSSLGEGFSSAALTVPLEGSVMSQTTLEVKQRGQLVYRTLLPAGPFSLRDIGPVMAGVEADITLTESDGRMQHFTVMPGDNAAVRPDRFQVALGRYRPYGPLREGHSPPALLLGERTLSLGEFAQVGGGAALSTAYQRAALQGNAGDSLGNWLSGGIVLSRRGPLGAQFDLQGQTDISNNVALALSSQYRTAGFREADESLSLPEDIDDSSGRVRYTGGLSLSWRAPKWGALTYSLTHERYYRDSRQNWMHALAYGTRLGNASLSLSLQSSTRERAALYANISLPLGSGRLSSRLQTRQNKRMAVSTGWQGDIGERFSGALEVTRDGLGEYQTSGSLSGDSPYTRLSLGASRNGGDSSSMSLSASGGVAVANNTWVTSPQRIGDTLAVISVPGQSGARVSGSAGGTTDFAGDALLPSVSPYRPVTAQVETLTLPLNIRLDSTSAEFELARGTVAQRHFRVTEVRQLLLTVRDEQGGIMQTGASVHDDKGQLLGTLIGNGNLMLVNDDIGKVLWVRRLNMNACRIEYDVPERFAPSVLYEERQAVCR